MKASNIKTGMKIAQTSHREYGDWRIQNQVVPGTWVVKGRTGEICVSETELKRFWTEV